MSRSLGAHLGAFLLAAALSLGAEPRALAQQSSGSGWFVPKGQSSEGASGAVARRRQAPAPSIDSSASGEGDGQQASQDTPQTQPVLPLPPIPAPAEIAKGAPPPAPAIGVLSVQDVMRASTAAQQVQRVLGARRDRLNQDAQKEQAAWRELQQQIQNSKASPDQLQTRERALQQRVLQAQRAFRNRNRILQEAAQVSLGQVERELVQVIRQVAAAHTMNLVLHREQVALNVNDFDITAQVATQLNATLTSVFIPGEDVDPEELAKSGTFPTTANPGGNPTAPASPAIASAAPAASDPPATPGKH